MAYSHDVFPFPMEQQMQANLYFPQPMPYTQFLPHHQPHPSDMMFGPHIYQDYNDFIPMGMMPEDYDDGSEVSTRPRLTKEQVEVLEAQFQAHPKPNSMVKKQLAIQTKLTLPRVANWFQNRRAKAKQQRKQEEFEIAQGMGTTGGFAAGALAGSVEASSKPSSPKKHSTNEDRPQSVDSKQSSNSGTVRDAGWASLQRALGAAEAERQQHHQRQHAQGSAQNMLTMPPPERPATTHVVAHRQATSLAVQKASLSPSSDLSNDKGLSRLTSPISLPMAATVQDLGFDFGFDQETLTTNHSNDIGSPENPDQQYLVSPEEWATNYTTHSSSTPQQSDFTSTDMSPLTLPTYVESRRGSGADELTADLGTFALAGTPPVSVASLAHMAAIARPTDGEIDIASRRKRPRPAALTTASLRSRSYGQLSSTSPAFPRPNPAGVNALRHVKSTGHNLNLHYAGVRKSSLPQRSPMNLSFAETESFQRLMAQQAAAASSKTPLTTPSRHDVGPSFMSQDMAAQLMLEENASNVSPLDGLSRYHPLQSPPHTPFQTEYMMQASASMPPPSARSQYASFAECTPPYSAGPLTNSTCWSDAPLHSPDVMGFPSNHFMSSLAFSQPDPAGLQWMMPSDSSNDYSVHQMGMSEENKKTEFFITEFPGQKEEYANIAQQSLHAKPKNYVFANTAPSDYDG